MTKEEYLKVINSYDRLEEAAIEMARIMNPDPAQDWDVSFGETFIYCQAVKYFGESRETMGYKDWTFSLDQVLPYVKE